MKSRRQFSTAINNDYKARQKNFITEFSAVFDEPDLLNYIDDAGKLAMIYHEKFQGLLKDLMDQRNTLKFNEAKLLQIHQMKHLPAGLRIIINSFFDNSK